MIGTRRSLHIWGVVAALAVVAALPAAPASGNGDGSVRCRSVQHEGERAVAIRARHVRCRKARSVAREYLRFNEVEGWRCRTRSSGRRVCARGVRRVGFDIVGEGTAD